MCNLDFLRLVFIFYLLTSVHQRPGASADLPDDRFLALEDKIIFSHFNFNMFLKARISMIPMRYELKESHY